MQTSVPPWWIPEVRKFVSIIDRIGGDLEVSLSGPRAWQRSRRENAAVRGKPRSQHLVALAIDLTGPDVREFQRRARAAGLVTIDEGDHLHVQRYAAAVLPDEVFQRVAVA
jgi:hypothetical protein